jgi:hypothetical protein
MDHTILEDSLPLVFDSLHLVYQLASIEEVKKADLVVNTENNIYICLIVPFSIIIEFTLAIVQVRVDDFVSRH